MTLDVERFTRKPEAVEAVQVTEDNMAEVAARYPWCRLAQIDYYSPPRPFLAIERNGGMAAYAGDWIAMQGDACAVLSDVEVVEAWQPALPSTAQVTEYRLSLLPEGHIDRAKFSVWVRRAGNPDLWAIWGYAGDSLDAAGNWVWRSLADADWWPFEEAMRRAEEALPRVEVMGKTAADVLAERGEAGT